MRTHYRDRSRRITSSAIWVEDHRYGLDEVADLWTCHIVVWPGLRPLLVESLRFLANYGLLLVYVAGGMAGWFYICSVFWRDLSNAFHVTVLVVSWLLVVAAAYPVGLACGYIDNRLRRASEPVCISFRRLHEIRMIWRNTEIVVLQTHDKVLFGKVYRAITRALENHVATMENRIG